MPSLDPQIGAINERSSERMNFRTKPRIKKTIQRAAALSGVDDSVFTVNAAYRSALETIAAHERTFLHPIDYDVFLRPLMPMPTPMKSCARRLIATRRPLPRCDNRKIR